MNSTLPIQEWTIDEVGRWLADHHLRHLVPRFEALGITGEQLLTIDDNIMKTHLRITSPGERAALNGALMNLRSAVQQSQLHSKKTDRPRSTSFEIRKQGTPKERLMTMPHQQRKISLQHAPELKLAPAPQLLDDCCRHSGWIRKMGGSYKSCESHASGLVT